VRVKNSCRREDKKKRGKTGKEGEVTSAPSTGGCEKRWTTKTSIDPASNLTKRGERKMERKVKVSKRSRKKKENVPLKTGCIRKAQREC